MNNKVIFIVGPTASGKTSLSIEIAKKINGEIISADSMQIYKNIHIASAAPDEIEKQGIPHHLIEFLEPDIQFSVADYVKVARNCINDILNRNKIPIIVGGTGLYIDSLLYNTEFIQQETDEELRKDLEKQFDELGGEEMLRLLLEFDSESSKILHPNNKRRIIRAFEVYKLTGETITEQNNKSRLIPTPYDSLIIGINYSDRNKLYDRINKRVEIMLQNGLLNEAESFYKSDYKKGAFQAIGHKELLMYLNGNSSLDEACEKLKMQTRRYAKRQMTWFNKNKDIKWFYPDLNENYINSALITIENFLKEV